MNVDIIGPVDQVASFYDRIDVAVAPVERGGGMKVKVVEAMMHGVPVVATEHAKDGLPDALRAEIIDLESVSGGLRNRASTLRDPRENPAVALALESFTFRSFQGTVNNLWQERMVTHH
jgi:glycosyltransferase involved in cell wall biosynthesis